MTTTRSRWALARRMTFALALLAIPAIASAQTVIVVRHAERADGGAGSSSMTDKPVDPPLSAAGELRAAKLAEVLADSGVKHIFTTEFKRTQDTAKPLANKLGLKSVTVSAKETDVLVNLVKTKMGANDVVLIVGHSNTVPDIVRGLTGKTIEMKDEEYNAMYVLNISARSSALIRW